MTTPVGRPLIRCADGQQTPGWIADAARLYCAGHAEIYLINPDGGGQNRLTNNRVSGSSPAMSPDSNTIAFVTNKPGRVEPPESDPLTLRVSAAVLVRALFPHPAGGEMQLALERRATVRAEPGHAVHVRAQPFGGAVRLRDPAALRALIGDFQFDSDTSRAEEDFRILIRPADWPVVRQFCLAHLAADVDPTLETDPARELEEEFAETLGFRLLPEHYRQRFAGLGLMDHPAPTDNARAHGVPTVRVYRIVEARLLDEALVRALLENSQGLSDDDLAQRALARQASAGRGRANAAQVLPLAQVVAAYQSLPPAARAQPFKVAGHLMDSNVAPILEADDG
jgi:hypothetical protein